MTTTPQPSGPIPSARQLAWHALETYGFLHFTTNTDDREIEMRAEKRLGPVDEVAFDQRPQHLAQPGADLGIGRRRPSSRHLGQDGLGRGVAELDQPLLGGFARLKLRRASSAMDNATSRGSAAAARVTAGRTNRPAPATSRLEEICSA